MYNINKGPVPLRCASEACHCGSEHNTRALPAARLNGMQPVIIVQKVKLSLMRNVY